MTKYIRLVDALVHAVLTLISFINFLDILYVYRYIYIFTLKNVNIIEAIPCLQERF